MRSSHTGMAATASTIQAVLRGPDGAVRNVVGGERLSVGRRGHFVLGAHDPYMHETAFWFAATADGWLVRTPDGRRDVAIRIEREDPFGLGESEGRLLSAASAEVHVHTVMHVHRLGVSYLGASPAADGGSTEVSLPLLRATDSDERALIVACARELTAPGAGALSNREVGVRLGITQGAAKERMRRAIGEALPWLIDAGVSVSGRPEDLRHQVVKWLVATALVDGQLITDAERLESLQQRGRST